MNLESFFQSPWMMWAVLALILAIMEIAVPIFAFSFVSFAAVISALVSLKWGGPVQLLVFMASTLLSILIVRPRILNRVHRHHPMPSRAQALVGLRGVVSEDVDPVVGTGRVMVEGQDWAAKSHSVISVGKSVEVEKHDGIVLIIKEVL
jgi:membrane protein implicated in regulation of membrane protease activity